jgi:hypothetical protein
MLTQLPYCEQPNDSTLPKNPTDATKKHQPSSQLFQHPNFEVTELSALRGPFRNAVSTPNPATDPRVTPNPDQQMTSLPQLARRHCFATKPSLCFKGFVSTIYGITHREFRYLATGRHRPSAQFLSRLSNHHLRLFPTEPVTLRLPGQPPVLIGSNAPGPGRPWKSAGRAPGQH